MKLYRLYKGCEGEYSCDNYLGLFKTITSMLFFLENYVKSEYGFKNCSISLNENNELLFSGISDDGWMFENYRYETIDTDELN
jgi:hypothetical protein